MMIPSADENLDQWALSHTPRKTKCWPNLPREQFEFISKLQVFAYSFESFGYSHMATPMQVTQISKKPDHLKITTITEEIASWAVSF